MTCFIMVVLSQTLSTSEICLYVVHVIVQLDSTDQNPVYTELKKKWRPAPDLREFPSSWGVWPLLDSGAVEQYRPYAVLGEVICILMKFKSSGGS